eukprot:gene19548-26230_t
MNFADLPEQIVWKVLASTNNPILYRGVCKLTDTLCREFFEGWFGINVSRGSILYIEDINFIAGRFKHPISFSVTYYFHRGRVCGTPLQLGADNAWEIMNDDREYQPFYCISSSNEDYESDESS